jgi:hypothetical protein
MMRLIWLFCALLTAQSATADIGIGRLFFTPAERAKLDELRANAKSVEIIDPTGLEAPAELAPPSNVSIQGYVKRGDGKKSTVWVNGQPVQENSTGAGVEVGRIQNGSNQIPLMLPNSGKSLRLKAGQVYSPATDSVNEMGTTRSDQAYPERSGTIGDPVSPADDKPSRP